METETEAVAGKILLIVEDDLMPAMALRDEFQDAGYQVMELMVNCQEALAAAKACMPDFALVNIELQGRDDGIELAADLKAMGVPVLFISGQSSRARSARTAALGSLPKPYRTSNVLLAVEYLQRHLRGDESSPPPEGLEVFDQVPDQSVPDAA